MSNERQGPPTYDRRPARWGSKPIYGLSTVQLGLGDLFDWTPQGAGPIHLVRAYAGGTPGPLLCGLDHHTLPVGFSVGGGSSSPALGDDDPATVPCQTCVAVAARMALGVDVLRITGSVGGERAATAVCVELMRMGANEIATVEMFDSWGEGSRAWNRAQREEAGDAS